MINLYVSKKLIRRLLRSAYVLRSAQGGAQLLTDAESVALSLGYDKDSILAWKLTELTVGLSDGS